MCLCHGLCFIIHFIFETGVLHLCITMRDSKQLVIPAYALFIQIILYQGLVIAECNFFLYDLLPAIQPEGKGKVQDFIFGEFSFEKIDFFDVLMMADFIAFYINLIWIFVLLVKGVYMNPVNIDDQIKLDFLEDDYFIKNMEIQVMSFFSMCLTFLIMISTSMK